ncbi:MAG: GNAT family N-acetyltransferase, partial [Calditrichia bacterium]
MINIREMLPRDRSPVYEILQQTDMFTPPEVGVAMELIDTYLFNKEQKDYLIYSAVTENNEIAGYVCYGPTPATDGTFDLYWIAVSPEFQNQGIGKQLLHFVEEKVREGSGRIIIIETSSQEKYAPTQNFYLRNNYQLEAVIKDFYRPNDHRLIFVKHLVNTINGRKKNGALAKGIT